MNIKELSINELKVLFYDELERLELAQNNISAIKRELAQRAQVKAEGVKTEGVKRPAKDNVGGS